MVRKHFNLPQEQLDKLQKLSNTNGLSKSENLRVILDQYFKSLETIASASQSKRKGDE